MNETFVTYRVTHDLMIIFDFMDADDSNKNCYMEIQDKYLTELLNKQLSVIDVQCNGHYNLQI